jgi:hypothetical protein
MYYTCIMYYVFCTWLKKVKLFTFIFIFKFPNTDNLCKGSNFKDKGFGQFYRSLLPGVGKGEIKGVQTEYYKYTVFTYKGHLKKKKRKKRMGGQMPKYDYT